MTDHSEARERARQEFEKWAIDAGWDITKDNSIEDDRYSSPITQSLLDCWQARGRSLEQERWISVEERLPAKNGEYLILEIGDKEASPADWFGDVWLTVRTYGIDSEQRELYSVEYWAEMPKAPAPPVHKGDS